ncbi:MAG: PDZ domain-containing protein [Proteobacteria bacterium]|nr:PDZ domain-containing protein [Pseudomonadota bacterium]
MRQVLLVVLAALAGCAPKVRTTPVAVDEDLPRDQVVAPVAATEITRPEAPAGTGERTGVIDRARLVAILDQGPGVFLRQVEVAPSLRGDRFVGWQLVQFVDRASPLGAVDLAPGDVLLAINGQPISRPDQLQHVWDSLRTSNAVVAQLWRGEAKFELEFQIEPKLP